MPRTGDSGKGWACRFYGLWRKAGTVVRAQIGFRAILSFQKHQKHILLG
jgi:hypothetical protein